MDSSNDRGHGDGIESATSSPQPPTPVVTDNKSSAAQNTSDGATASTSDSIDIVPTESFKFSNSLTFEELRHLQMKFIRERNWDQFHPPRNVLLALVGEVGELAEIFQWKGEVTEGLPELSVAEREHVGQEISDVLLYLIDLAVRCRVDLPKAVIEKMAANSKKYPVDKSYGKANKYTDYK